MAYFQNAIFLVMSTNDYCYISMQRFVYRGSSASMLQTYTCIDLNRLYGQNNLIFIISQGMPILNRVTTSQVSRQRKADRLYRVSAPFLVYVYTVVLKTMSVILLKRGQPLLIKILLWIQPDNFHISLLTNPRGNFCCRLYLQTYTDPFQ